MINKALFKQSCKANWIKWLAVTLSTCIMLMIVIIVLGNLGINDIRDSLKDVFVQADQESYLKENAVDGYELYLTSVDGYSVLYSKQLYMPLLQGQFDSAVEDYENQFGEGSATKDVRDNQIIPQLVSAIISNPMLAGAFEGMDETTATIFLTTYLTIYSDNQLNETSKTNDEILQETYAQMVFENAYQQEIASGKSEEEAFVNAMFAKAVALDAAKEYTKNNTTPEFDYSTVATNFINLQMQNQAEQSLADSEMSEEEIKQYGVAVKVISNTAITTYQLWLEELGGTEEAKVEAKAQATQSISDQIPEKVAVALQELGNMDMYGLIIGSIFYRIAGLLLPMVFVIMTANGLLAGQVDSGSMAYVLSTPTKRRTVTVTQLAYLVFALFSMFALLTVFSVIAVAVAGGNNFAINFAEILLLNAGAFITMFAIAGFCFMCSALFNTTKHSLSIGGGLTIFSLVCTILGLFGSTVIPSAMRISAMNFFNYLSIITLFDTVSILNGTLSYLWKFGILAGIGLIGIIVGVFRFDKKDLPL